MLINYNIMLTFIVLFILFCTNNAFEPSCLNCKHYLPHNRDVEELGLCKMFTNICYDKNKGVTIPNYAYHCRNDENLCGQLGFLYEHKDSENRKAELELKNQLIELNNRCCGEVNESDEIEQLEKDFFEVFQKIKKHNKRQIFKTTKDLYKLFKRD